MSHSAGRHLLVEAGEALFAVDALQVREILEPLRATPVPGAVPAALGLINLRGTVVVAAELGALLNLRSESSDEAALVVVELSGRRIALKVDRLVGLVADLSGQVEVTSDLLEALGAREMVRDVTQFEERPCFHLDLHEICAEVLEPTEDSDRVSRPRSTGGWR